MPTRRLALSLTISLGALLLPVSAAHAVACDVWYGPGGSSSEAKSGSWGTPSNWSTGLVPESNDQACITAPGTYTVNLVPYGGTHYGETAGDGVEALTIGAASGTQKLEIIGEGAEVIGNWYNETYLDVGYGVTIGAHGVVVLDSTESNGENQTGEPHGGNAMLEQDTSGQPGHPFVNEGTIVAQTSSSKWIDKIHSHSLTNHGSVQVSSGTLSINSEESSTSTGSMATAAGATLTMGNLVTFTNDGTVANDGTTILNGYPTGGKWIQGPGAITGNPVEVEHGGGLEDSATSGAGAFSFGLAGGGFLLGTVPAGQTIDLASTPYPGAMTLSLGEKQLVNDGTINLDVPLGSDGNTNIEFGSIANNGVIRGTVENGAFMNVIDVPVANEGSGTIAANSGTLFDNRSVANNGRLEVAPSSVFELVATNFTNSPTGVIAPQIASASSFGRIELKIRAMLESGGTLAPTLVGGFVPNAGQEFAVIPWEGGNSTGTFATVSGGFSGDYSHEKTEPAYVGVVYGALPSPSGGGTGTPTTKKPAPAKVAKVTTSAGFATVKLTCPKGGAACGKVSVKATVIEHLEKGRVVALSAGKKKAKATTKVVVVASGSATLAAGGKATLKLRINSTGKALLHKHHSLPALVTITQGSSKVATKKVTLKG